MDANIFVENVKKICASKGIGVTAACEASGAGKSLISDINRGINPRIERIARLATYLDCTVSQLYGEEKKEPTTVPGDGLDPEMLDMLRRVPPEKMEEVKRYLRFQAEQQ